MKETIRLSMTLMLAAFISACSLSLINKLTKSEIISQGQKDLDNALLYVLPGSNSQDITPIEKENRTLYYMGYEDQNKTDIIGYAFVVESQGYSSIIRTLVGIDTTGKILRIKILSQQETPGLGARCEEIRNGELIPWWQAQFQNVNLNDVAINKDGGLIESITGATITSRAITDSIANKTRTLLTTLYGRTDDINE